ncbi:MAG: nickel pincer cofactor biosynthesis protein LarB, partial [bacterium]|nr:nickel pincer cofactor biosynthesis protein LarB [bacterium]
MNKETLQELIEAVQKGALSVPQAMERLAGWPYENLQFARLDHHREARTGLPEVIWGEQKTIEQIQILVKKMIEKKSDVLATRLSSEKGEALLKTFPQGSYSAEGRIFSLKVKPSSPSGRGTILVLTAGTSDIPVAEEACLTAQFLGNEVKRLYDVGVAGLHRLLDALDEIQQASVLIVIAGMEGALPSVIAG